MKKYTTTKKADALAADAATHKMKKLNKELFNQTEKQMFDMKHFEIINSDSKVILYNNYIIFKSYNGHINDRNKYSKTRHYSDLWNMKQIYL